MNFYFLELPILSLDLYYHPTVGFSLTLSQATAEEGRRLQCPFQWPFPLWPRPVFVTTWAMEGMVAGI